MVLNAEKNSKILIQSLKKGQSVSLGDKIEKITLLGHGALNFKRTANGVEIRLPKKLPNDYVLVFKVQCKGKVLYRKSQGSNDVMPAQT